MKKIARRVVRAKKTTASSPTLPSPRPEQIKPPKLAPEAEPRATVLPPPPAPRTPAPSLQQELNAALDDIDGAREAMEELAWDASDATSEEPAMVPQSLHVGVLHRALDGFHSLRSAMRRISEVRWQLSQRGVL